jgi:hypothetical protein
MGKHLNKELINQLPAHLLRLKNNFKKGKIFQGILMNLNNSQSLILMMAIDFLLIIKTL